MDADEARAALYAYTLARGDAAFIHQHVVDAICAQDADASTPAMRLAFALVGLYLHVERGYTGRQVQQLHTVLARRPTIWPVFALPSSRGTLTIRDVLHAPAGPTRDAAIDAWCATIWAAYATCRDDVIGFLRQYNAD
jgi:hypothetical protein